MKSQHNNKMEDILKNKFEQFNPAPPAGLFAAIEPQIENKATKKTVFFTYTRLAVAACFLFLLGIGYLFLWPANTTNYNNIANTKTPQSRENSYKQEVSSTTLADIEPEKLNQHEKVGGVKKTEVKTSVKADIYKTSIDENMAKEPKNEARKNIVQEEKAPVHYTHNMEQKAPSLPAPTIDNNNVQTNVMVSYATPDVKDETIAMSKKSKSLREVIIDKINDSEHFDLGMSEESNRKKFNLSYRGVGVSTSYAAR